MKIIVYDDNPDYGGHQVMASHGIEALVADPAHEIVCMFNSANRKLALRLPQTAGFQILAAPCTTRKFQGLLNHVSKPAITALAEQFKSLDADLILCIQGEIEDSSQALLAAKEAGIECVSYLAIPHTMQLMGAKLGRLRDRINHYLFAQPSRYIVISESMQALLEQRGATAPIEIVPNGIPSPPSSPMMPHGSHLTLGMFGRIEFNQKQQDFMVRCFCKNPETFSTCRLLIAGTGPDADQLARQVARCSRSEDITMLPWQDNVNDFYGQIDVLMLPSRFEGVPLVMLEALVRGIPVIASRRDGMQDILPEEWTFEPGNAAALAQTFSSARSLWPNQIEPLQHHVKTEMSLDPFKSNFVRAVTQA